MMITPVKSRYYEEEAEHKNKMTQKAAMRLASMGIVQPNPLTDENYYDNNLAYQERLLTLVTRFMNYRD